MRKFYTYVQELNEDNFNRHLEFCNNMSERLMNDPHLFFGMSAVFFVNGTVNGHKFRYGIDENTYSIKTVHKTPKNYIWALLVFYQKVYPKKCFTIVTRYCRASIHRNYYYMVAGLFEEEQQSHLKRKCYRSQPESLNDSLTNAGRLTQKYYGTSETILNKICTIIWKPEFNITNYSVNNRQESPPFARLVLPKALRIVFFLEKLVIKI